MIKCLSQFNIFIQITPLDLLSLQFLFAFAQKGTIFSISLSSSSSSSSSSSNSKLGFPTKPAFGILHSTRNLRSFEVVIMEGRRRHKSDNYRRSQNKRPPRGNCSWQPTVPSWEKEFCRVIGSLDWETLLQMKKFVHLYENVIKWNDSAGEEAFSNAKKRFWAEINGRPSDLSLPDPDLYIDKIDWDSETDPDLLSDLETDHLNSNADEDHDPVVIFGDSLFPSQAYSATGWGDDDENFKVPTNSSSGNHGPPLMQNWGNSFENGATIGWPSYYNNAWQFGDGNKPPGYMTWGGGWNNDWGWSYSNNNVIYGVQPDIEQTMDYQEQGQWNDRNVAKANVGRVEENGRDKNHTNRHQKAPNSRAWNSCAPSSHHAAITVGQTWKR